MRVSEVTVYPVKSMRGSGVARAEVEPWGLAGDRRWAVVDGDGDPVTARDCPALLSVTALPADGGGVTLTAAGRAPVSVAPPAGGEPVRVGFSRLDRAFSAGAVADGWLSAVIGAPCRMVWLDDPSRRTVSAKHGGRPGDRLSLADTGPLLLTSESSLRRLNEWIEATASADGRPVEPVPMRRFRPNVVVAGADPFAEDDWTRVRIGTVEFRMGELCDRCVLTTIDEETLARGKEPLRTLARHRRWDGRVWFGVRLIPTTAGLVEVGAEVTAA